MLLSLVLLLLTTLFLLLFPCDWGKETQHRMTPTDPPGSKSERWKTRIRQRALLHVQAFDAKQVYLEISITCTLLPSADKSPAPISQSQISQSAGMKSEATATNWSQDAGK